MSAFANYKFDFNPDRPRQENKEQLPAEFRQYNQLVEEVVNRQMRPQQQSLGDFLRKSVLKIPEYQRAYSWTEEQWDPLWNDLIAVTKVKFDHRHKGRDLFFGILFIAESDSSGVKYDVIDGQQRLTTIGLILRALLSRMEKVGDSDLKNESSHAYKKRFLYDVRQYLYQEEGEIHAPTPRILLDKINRKEYQLIVAPDEYRSELLKKLEGAHGNARRNAMTLKRLLSVLEIQETGEPGFPGNLRIPETSKLIITGYEYFCKQIDSELLGFDADQKVRFIANLLGYIMKCFSITVFSLGKDYPELLMDVFEVLNNRGMDLALTDVVNARIVQRFSTAEPAVNEKYVEMWRETMEQLGRHSESLRDYLIDFLTSRYPHLGSRTFHSDRLLEAFSHKSAPDDGSTHEVALLEDLDKAQETLKELKEGSLLYSFLIDSSGGPFKFGEIEHLDAFIVDGIRRLQALQTRQWRALVLACGLDVVDNPLKSHLEWFYRLVDAVERVSLRQSICGVNPNRMEDVYREAIRKFRSDGFSDRVIDKIWEVFYRSYGDSGNANALYSAIINKDDWNNNVAKVLLWRTHALSHSKSSLEIRRLNSSAIHLEHVIPQAAYYTKGNEQPWLDGFFSGLPKYENVKTVLETNGIKQNRFLEEFNAFFVKDLGNVVLLLDTVNVAVSNNTFSYKLAYYNRTPGFGGLSVNQPFSSESEFPEHKELRMRILEYLDSKEGNPRTKTGHSKKTSSDSIKNLQEQIEKHPSKKIVDQAWTAEKLAERRVEVLRGALSTLGGPGEDFSRCFSDQEVKQVIDSRIEVLFSEVRR